MKPAQAAIAVAAVVAVVLVYVIVGSGGGDKGGGGGGNGNAPTKAPKGSVSVTFAYSPEKDALLKPLIEQFNASDTKVNGQRIFVQGSSESSGDTESRIANGREKPVVWSPAGSLWGTLLNFEGDQPLAPESAPSIVRTPLVIAMWEPMAKALGYPNKKLGFADLLKLAQDKRGWAAYGKPQYGQFKLVHTNPDFSTAGLEATVAEYYAATGKKEGLTEQEVSNSKARETVKQLEQSIVHYGDTTLFVEQQLKAEGEGYASAVAIEETTLLDFNKTRGSRDKLVAIYPSEGSFDSDSPFFVLNGSWVSAAQKSGAEAFQKFLAQKITPQLAGKYGFRPSDPKTKPDPGIFTAANGVDPNQPERTLGLPSPRVLAKIKSSWRADRKPANVLLVIDTSGSMNDENRLVDAKAGMDAFLKAVGSQDRVGLLSFNDRITPILKIGASKAELRSAVNDLIADGGTAVHDAAVEAFNDVRDMKDTGRINAVVLLTDGEDTDSTRYQSLDSALKVLRSQGDSENRVREFTIAYSAGAEGSKEALQQIADATGGKAYQAETSDIESVYRSISSFF